MLASVAGRSIGSGTSTLADPIELLTRAHIVEPAHVVLPDRHIGLRLGDQTGLLDRTVTEALVDELAALLTPEVAGLAVGNGVADVLIGYLVAGARGISLVSVSNDDGVVTATGAFPDSGEVWLFAAIVGEAALLDEFEAACRRAGAAPGMTIAVVDRIPVPDPRVQALVRWSDHSWEPTECPVCRGQI
jgi:hypothetical protein